jgi:hypothetical protein
MGDPRWSRVLYAVSDPQSHYSELGWYDRDSELKIPDLRAQKRKHYFFKIL